MAEARVQRRLAAILAAETAEAQWARRCGRRQHGDHHGPCGRAGDSPRTAGATLGVPRAETDASACYLAAAANGCAAAAGRFSLRNARTCRFGRSCMKACVRTSR